MGERTSATCKARIVRNTHLRPRGPRRASARAAVHVIAQCTRRLRIPVTSIAAVQRAAVCMWGSRWWACGCGGVVVWWCGGVVVMGKTRRNICAVRTMLYITLRAVLDTTGLHRKGKTHTREVYCFFKK